MLFVSFREENKKRNATILLRYIILSKQAPVDILNVTSSVSCVSWVYFVLAVYFNFVVFLDLNALSLSGAS